MRCVVLFHDDFRPEFRLLPHPVKLELAARAKALEEFGPDYGRPTVDTLRDSTHPNMKEIRFRLDGLWRFAFVFDPERNAVVLCGGNKLGKNQDRFYADLIKTADARFKTHLAKPKAPAAAETPAAAEASRKNR